MRRNGQKTYLIPLIIGVLLMALPVIFLYEDLPVALCSLCWPFFFLLAERKCGSRGQFIVTGAGFVLSFAVRFITYLGSTARGMLIMASMGICIGAVMFVPFIIDRLLFRKQGGFLKAFVFPVLYTALLVLMSVLSFPVMGDPACGAIALPRMAQGAALVLSHGLSFLVLLVSSLLALAAVIGFGRCRIFALITAAVIAAAMPVYGSVRLAGRTGEPVGTLRVALMNKIESDFFDAEYPFTDEESIARLEEHLAFAAENGADLAVSTEEYVHYPAVKETEKTEELSAIVAKYGIPAVICVDMYTEDDLNDINTLFLFDGNGNVLDKYIKQKLVPIVEQPYYVTGTTPPGEAEIELKGQTYKLAYAICFDCSDALFTRQISPDRQLLIDPSWEWDACNADQRRTVALRAIENDITLLKNTYDGWSSVTDPYGVKLAEQDMRPLRGQACMMEVPVY